MTSVCQGFLVYGTLPKPEIAQSDEQGQFHASKLALECMVHIPSLVNEMKISLHKTRSKEAE